MHEERALRVNEGLNSLTMQIDAQAEDELILLMERLRELIAMDAGMAERALAGWLSEVNV